MAKHRKKTLTEISEPWSSGKMLGIVSPDIAHFPDSKRSGRCPECNRLYFEHGWVATREGGHIVCPGDRIATGQEGEHYLIKPSAFKTTYERNVENG